MKNFIYIPDNSRLGFDWLWEE